MAGVAARRRAFTLAELMVAISIIALASAIVLPSAASLFTTSADEQARAVLGATLGAIRAAAIEEGAYTAVHIQVDDEGLCWAAPFKGEVEDDGVIFYPYEKFQPRRMPGGIAFGEVSDRFIQSGAYNVTNLEDFTSFTIVFSPEGVLVNQPMGGDVQLANYVSPGGDEDRILFGGGDDAIWDSVPAPETGVRAVTFFKYSDLQTQSNRSAYLDDYGQFVCLNPYTGQLMETE